MNLKIKCCNKTNPVGVIDPDFTWHITKDGVKRQNGYELQIFNDEYSYNSGKVEDEKSVRVKCDTLKLKNNTKYYWNVKVYTDKGEYQSDNGWFITGLIDEPEICWITAPSKIQSPLLKKDFYLDEINDYAVVNICGLGFFELYINGKKVSNDFMQPVRTDYDRISYKNLAYPFLGTTRKSVCYVTYEVSDYLNKGINTVEIWLGNGWYRQNGRLVEGKFDYGSELKAFFRLESGDILIESNDSWQCAESPIIYNNLFYGEVCDANIIPIYKNDVTIIEKPDAILVSQLCPADRIVKTYEPVEIKKDIYDTGESITGFATVTVNGVKGEKIEIYYAEDFDGNELDYKSTVGYVEQDKNQIQKDVYILNGIGEERYTPRFTWHSFRYLYVVHSNNVEIKNVTTYFVCTDMERRTKFCCSDDILNRIDAMYHNTVRANMHGCVPMDCPHRERLGYTGDGQLSSNSAMYNYDAYDVYKKWIRDIFDAQDMETGFVPHTAPFNGGGGGPGWGSAVAIVPWNFYNQYGDVEFLKESVLHIKKWIYYLSERKNEEGLICREEGGSWCLGDWVMPSKYPWSEPHLDEIRVESELVNTYFYITCIDIYIKILNQLNIAVDEWFTTEKEASVSALKKKYSDCDDFDQGSELFLIYTNTTDRKEELLDAYINRAKTRNYTFNTGIVGTELLFKVLEQCDRNDIALKMLTSTDYPSFGNMLKKGATAIWETWEGNGAKNHEGLSSVDSWIYYGLLGIKPDCGYKRFTIKPYFADQLTFVNSKIDTEYGRICVCWKREADKIQLNITIPFNTTARLVLADKEVELDCGEYIYNIRCNLK